jgi:hypothetical protein
MSASDLIFDNPGAASGTLVFIGVGEDPHQSAENPRRNARRSPSRRRPTSHLEEGVTKCNGWVTRSPIANYPSRSCVQRRG